MTILVHFKLCWWLCVSAAVCSGVQNQLTICSTEDSNDCNGDLTLKQLAFNSSLIQSNTTLVFQPTNFSMEFLLIENVSNIVFDAMPGPQKPLLACNNSGPLSHFVFVNVSVVAIRNIDFIGCGSAKPMTLDFKVSAGITLFNVTIKQGKSCGVKIFNAYDYVTISHASFAQMHGTSICLDYYFGYKPQQLGHISFVIIIENSNFTENYCIENYRKGCTLDVVIFKFLYPLQIRISDIRVINCTQSSNISDINIVSTPYQPNTIHLFRYHREGNSIIASLSSNESGGSDFYYVHNYSAVNRLSGTTNIDISYSEFINNVIYSDSDDFDPFDIDQSSLYGIISIHIDKPHRHMLSISNVTIANNTGKLGSAVYYNAFSSNQDTSFDIATSVFANNTIYSSDYYKKGVVVLKHLSVASLFRCSFINNTGTGLLLENSKIVVDHNIFKGNHAIYGGAIGLWDSTIHLYNNVTIESNSADNLGGGLYIKKSDVLNSSNLFENECFITRYDYVSPILQLGSNFAKVAGNDIYGGDLYTCAISGRPGWKTMKDIIVSPENYTVDVTSDPLRVCDCSNARNNQACYNVAKTIKTVNTYPGKKFNLSLMAVGQLVSSNTISGVPSSIYASLLQPLNSTRVQSGNIPNTMQVQNVERFCTNLTYLVNSTNNHEVLVLVVSNKLFNAPDYFLTLWEDDSRWHDRIEKVVMHGLLVPAYVEIEFLSCPVGFELSSNGVCVCSDAIQDYVTSCSIDTELLQRKLSYWIGITFQNNSEPRDETIYLTHKHCPFDYCHIGTFNFSLKDPDHQCNYNHSGILCGKCKSGYSLVLGDIEECQKCTNIHLLLLIPFVFAGICLVAFLSLTDMTVASGTLNGLLFYANVLEDNKAAYFPPQTAHSFLSVFIAWLNLDLGIGSCFYNGLDAYVYTWLQMSFPFYIWLLTFVIIILCRHFSLMSRLFGSNIVPVLATLFLLSYTKLLRTIITSLSFTIIQVSEGRPLLVWLKDGNVPYLEGKHIILFLASIVLLLLLLGYTLSIVLGPWLQGKTQYRVFHWVLKLKPLFDAYFGPFKDQHRYWTGVLLLARITLGLVSAANVFGDDSINLLSIITANVLLLNLLWQSGSVYKVWYVAIMESFLMGNLVILSSLTLFNKLSAGGSQTATIFVSTGSVFAVVCIIFFYHCVKQLRKLKKLYTPPLHDAKAEGDSDEDLLNVVDEGR